MTCNNGRVLLGKEVVIQLVRCMVLEEDVQKLLVCKLEIFRGNTQQGQESAEHCEEPQPWSVLGHRNILAVKHSHDYRVFVLPTDAMNNPAVQTDTTDAAACCHSFNPLKITL